MNQIKLMPLVILSSLLLAGCSEKQESIRFSFEECYRQNIQNNKLMTGWYHVTDPDNGFARQLDGDTAIYYIDPHPLVTVEDIVEKEVTENRDGFPILVMKFGERGTEAWKKATKEATYSLLALIVDDKLISAPYVNNEITNGVSAIGRADYPAEKLRQIEKQLHDGKQVLKEQS